MTAAERAGDSPEIACKASSGWSSHLAGALLAGDSAAVAGSAAWWDLDADAAALAGPQSHAMSDFASTLLQRNKHLEQRGAVSIIPSKATSDAASKRLSCSMVQGPSGTVVGIVARAVIASMTGKSNHRVAPVGEGRRFRIRLLRRSVLPEMYSCKTSSSVL